MSEMRLVAGGGGHPTKSSALFLEEAFNLSGDERPQLLIVPTPKSTSRAHDGIVNALARWCKEKGIQSHTLHRFDYKPSVTRTEDLLGIASVMYVTGGDTLKAVEAWREWGISALLKIAVMRGDTVACGISAGALWLCEKGFSDTDSYRVPEGTPWDYKIINGLGVLPVIGNPHHNGTHPITGKSRGEAFAETLARIRPPGLRGLGIDNAAALMVAGDTATVLNAKDGHDGIHTYHNDTNGLIHRVLRASDGPLRLSNLLGN